MWKNLIFPIPIFKCACHTLAICPSSLDAAWSTWRWCVGVAHHHACKKCFYATLCLNGEEVIGLLLYAAPNTPLPRVRDFPWMLCNSHGFPISNINENKNRQHQLLLFGGDPVHESVSSRFLLTISKFGGHAPDSSTKVVCPQLGGTEAIIHWPMIPVKCKQGNGQFLGKDHKSWACFGQGRKLSMFAQLLPLGAFFPAWRQVLQSGMHILPTLKPSQKDISLSPWQQCQG